MEQRKCKVLIATGIYPPDFRGPATMLEALPVSLKQNGFEVKVLTYSDVGRQKQDQDFVYRVLRKQFFFLRYLKFFALMYKLARWADVVYVTDTYSVGYFAYLIKKILRKKYVVRFAGDSAWEIASARGWTEDYIIDFQKKTYSKRIEKLKKRRKKILANAERVIAVSEFIASLAQLIGIRKEKIRVIYNSIDFINDNEINPVLTENIRNRYAKDGKLIVTACQLVKWKGVGGIIKILPRLKEKIGKVNLLVLGAGQELEKLKKLSEDLGVGGNVFFLGKIDRNKILNFFKAADLFILNTNYEGLSHTLLEVMRAGTPIIATSAGGNPEVIESGQDGILIGYDNYAELLAAAVRILGDSDFARRLTSQASEKLKKFSWAENVNKTTETLKEVIGYG